jgi:DNA-binding GntR family transcriptional regulator
MMERLTVLPVREQVAAVLRKAIFSNELEIGRELAQEEIAKQLGISRMPVREAFQILERDGLLTLKNNRSAVVRGLTKADLIDHYEIRAMLEGEAAARAKSSNSKFEEIMNAHQDVESAVSANNVAEYIAANEVFHRAIWEASESPRLMSLLNQLWNGLPPQVAEFLPGQAEKSVIEHKAILEAIRSGDTEGARGAMQGHVRRSMNDFLDQRGHIFTPSV